LRQLLVALAPPLLAVAATVLFDFACRRRRLDPPGFAHPAQRVAGLSVLALVFWVGVFFPLTQLGSAQEIDYESVPTWQLFLIHGLLILALAGWFAAGFWRAPARFATLREQLGLRARSLRTELGIGVAFGFAAWLAVLLTLIAIAVLLAAFGRGDLLPAEVPAAIPWIAGQSVALRLALAASAGVVEEAFFRGLLQPRVGIGASTALFALAHLSYGQPFMLVGVTLLSLFYGLLVKWRQSIWAAVVAHFIFDAIQLVIVIPVALRFSGSAGS